MRLQVYTRLRDVSSGSMCGDESISGWDGCEDGEDQDRECGDTATSDDHVTVDAAIEALNGEHRRLVLRYFDDTGDDVASYDDVIAYALDADHRPGSRPRARLREAPPPRLAEAGRPRSPRLRHPERDDPVPGRPAGRDLARGPPGVSSGARVRHPAGAVDVPAIRETDDGGGERGRRADPGPRSV